MKIEIWEHNTSIKKDEYSLNTNVAKRIAEKDCLKELSTAYTHINPENISKFFNKIPSIKNILVGDGIDLGGGPGIISGTLVNEFPEINNLILLEYIYEVMKHGFPIVKKYLLNEKTERKIRPTCGSFDSIKLHENSLDFAIFWDALHHSTNPINTLDEVYRVLKPTGKLIVVDRAHNNNTPQKEINRMLNVIYSEEFLAQNFLPKDKILTRKGNGEHEYMFKEWEYFFNKSSFKNCFCSLYLEKHQKNFHYKNDAGIEQHFLDFELGGFLRRKVLYILQPLK